MKEDDKKDDKKFFPTIRGLCTSCKTIFAHTNNSTLMNRNDFFKILE